MIDFSIEPEFKKKLDWMNSFVREECEMVDLLFPRASDMYDVKNSNARKIVRPLQQQVKDQELWACHLGPNLGGPGYGQVKLALMNEILGRSSWAPTIFGTQAPDTGNAEILAMFGTEEQKEKYLKPLMDGDIVSCFSMTEPQAGADPLEFECKAWQEGNEWVIDGYKWFSSNARYAEFLIVMAVTNPDNAPHERMSMFLVDAKTPGIEIIRNTKIMSDSPENEIDDGIHAFMKYNQVRVPLDAMLGEQGGAFKVAQARLGGGRIHHCMRTVGLLQRALDMMVERAVSRQTKGKLLSQHQFVQGMIADTAVDIEQFRLLILKAAWIIDNEPHGAARTHIGMCKIQLGKVFYEVAKRAVHLHGSLGVSLETPLAKMWAGAPTLAVADGPTEVHQVQVAKALLKNATPAPGFFPTDHNLTRLEQAKKKFAHLLED
ncbi:acyl-CoA dehydrogenase [Ketobacter sp. MCCC 1A13808]|uniref:acyl-CoA dehydrogenase family protein n=1 Tax=Ketobacter sp. MCCC 1A13808 TaxID=2602738 RepID=UPI000F106951|nr:acyl-CoA dehydrogenase family protein [Ketobacter sp. MCCC 1A13808]MVF12153.1 acyl-CoA dehydrogenase [Ketobacter sp. MCCC 1A13808]RLP53208.1 MAG: acyl-CoA dehydrogenase [Ketobacter sp.]